MMDIEKSKVYNQNDLNTMILYSHNGDEIINRYLLNGEKVTDETISYFRTRYYMTLGLYENCFLNDSNRFIESYLHNFYVSLRNCFKTKYDKDLLVYRGIREHVDYKENDIIKFNTFVSTTLSYKIAKNYGSIGWGKEGKFTLFSIYIPKGNYICPIFYNTLHEEELEILLMDSSYFIVNSIDEHDGYEHYILIYLGVYKSEIKDQNHPQLNPIISVEDAVKEDRISLLDLSINNNYYLLNKISDNKEILSLALSNINKELGMNSRIILKHLLNGKKTYQEVLSAFRSKTLDFNVLKWWIKNVPDSLITYNFIFNLLDNPMPVNQKNRNIT